MITVKGCVQNKDLKELAEGMDKAIIAFVYNSDHICLWPGEYVPATLTIEEAVRNEAVHPDLRDYINSISGEEG